MRLREDIVKYNADGCQNSEKDHDFEATADAGMDDLGGDHSGDGPEHLDEGDADDPDLGGVKLIKVDCVVVEGIADCELNEEEEDQH